MNTQSDMPLVSIIVRTQGCRPALLSRALASIAAQSYPRLEAFIVEDGSDNAKHSVETANALRPGAFNHLPIPKGGRCEAGNAGLRAARGEFLGFLDEDDEFYPNHVSKLQAALSGTPEFRLAYGRADAEFCEGLSRDKLAAAKKNTEAGFYPFSRTQLWLRNQFPIQSAVFRYDLYTEKGDLDPEFDCFEDWDLWLRYSVNEDFLAVDEITSLYRMPAAKKDLARRESLHQEWLPRIREKHRSMKAMHTFEDIQAVPAQTRNEIPFRQALTLTCAAFFQRAKELLGGRP